MTKQPTRKQIEASMVEDLRTAFEFVQKHEPTTPSDLAGDAVNSFNSRYSRELFGVLRDNADLITEAEEDGDFVLTPTALESSNPFGEWLTEAGLNATPSSTRSGEVTAKLVNEGGECYCGCTGRTSSTKSFYLPGHDARHAGQIGKAIAAARLDESADAESIKENVQVLLQELPSDKLTEKASNIGNRIFSKEMEKRAKVEARKAAKEAADKVLTESKSNPEPEGDAPYVGEGIITVGKNEYVAQIDEAGKVTYFKGEDELVASKTAAKTFQPA